MNRTAVVVLAFVGIFLAGAISGGFVGARVSETLAHRRAGELFAQQQFKRLAEQLSLTPEQRLRIHPIVTKAGKDVQEHRREISLIAEKMEADVRLQLTDQQREQFDRTRSRLHENEKLFQRWIREQRTRRQDAQGPAGPEAPAP